MSIEKIGIIANIEKEQSGECAIELRDWAAKKGYRSFWKRNCPEDWCG